MSYRPGTSKNIHKPPPIPSLNSNKSVPNLKKGISRPSISDSLSASQQKQSRMQWKDSIDKILGDFTPPSPSKQSTCTTQASLVPVGDQRVRVRKDNFFVENMKELFIEELPSEKIAKQNSMRRQHLQGLKDRYKSAGRSTYSESAKSYATCSPKKKYKTKVIRQTGPNTFLTGCGLEDYQEVQQIAIPQPQPSYRRDEPREMDAILADVMDAQNAMRQDFDDLEALTMLVNDTKCNLDTHISSVNNIRSNINQMRENAGRMQDSRRALSRAGSGIMQVAKRGTCSSALAYQKSTLSSRVPAVNKKNSLQKRVSSRRTQLQEYYEDDDDDYYFRNVDGIEMPGRSRGHDDSPRAEIMGKLWNINTGMKDFTTDLEGQMKGAFEAIRKKKMGKLTVPSSMSVVPAGKGFRL